MKEKRGSQTVGISNYHFEKLKKFVFLDKRFAKDNDTITPNRKKIVEDAIDFFYAVLSNDTDYIITNYNFPLKQIIKDVLKEELPSLKKYLEDHKKQ